MPDWVIWLYLSVGAVLYLRTWGHHRDGRYFPWVAAFPRPSHYTPEGQRRVRLMWWYYGLGALAVVVWLLALSA